MRTEKKTSSCIVCYFDKLNKVGNIYTLDGVNYHLYQCQNCLSVFTLPLPDDATLQKLYREVFSYNWYQDFYSTKLRDCKDRIQEYLNLLSGDVLDFGGGHGYFAEAAIQKGFNADLYDPFCHQNQQKPNKNNYDVIVSLHVLEHSNNPDALLAEMKQYLKPNGRVILCVPNYESLGYKKHGMGWVWAQPPLMHISHFTAKGLKILLERHGFTDLEVSYHDRWDANVYADCYHKKAFNWIDSLWHKSQKYPKWLQKGIVCFIKLARQFGFKRALKLNISKVLLSELQITGKLSDNCCIKCEE